MKTKTRKAKPAKFIPVPFNPPIRLAHRLEVLSKYSGMSVNEIVVETITDMFVAIDEQKQIDKLTPAQQRAARKAMNLPPDYLGGVK